MTEKDPLCGAVEAGGTKFVCMVGTGPGDMREQIRFPTPREPAADPNTASGIVPRAGGTVLEKSQLRFVKEEDRHLPDE